MHQRWFKMGGTTEHADNFVPVDECLVSFFVFQNQECRGRSPLPGFGVSPKNPLFTLAAAGGKKGLNP
jgi:hypothetical protein